MSTRTRDISIRVVFTLISILQALLTVFARKLDSPSGAILFGFSAVSIVWANTLFSKRDHSLALGVCLYIIQLPVFIIFVSNIEPLSVPRLLLVAIILIHLAIALFLLLFGLKVTTFEKAIAIVGSTVFVIFLCEALLGGYNSEVAGNHLFGPEWTGTLDPHPVLGCVYRPYSELRTYYPGNPRGYFKRVDPRERLWNLRVIQPNVAKLELPGENPDEIKVDRIKAETKLPSDIQANEPSFRIMEGIDYLIHFRVRSERPRSIIIGCANAHPPWNNLGLYEKVNVNEQWQTFEKSFRANANDQNARIHFDLGNTTPSVEIDSLSIKDLQNERIVRPALPAGKFFVSYQFNSLGCRGRDYSLNKSAESIRILLLGDSYTLGVGVNGQDTFGQQLEKLLNANGSRQRKINYEVINCGVSGYGTREERLFYRLFGKLYHPDIVILSMVWNDDMSFLDEVRKGYINRSPSKLELILKIWGKMQDFRHKRPFPDFSKNVHEIMLLNQETEKDRVRLLVDIFRNIDDFQGSTPLGRSWNSLTQTVVKGLQGTEIPVVELGKTLFKDPKQDLLVYGDLDDHPNEVAHRIAAEELFHELQRLHWVKQ